MMVSNLSFAPSLYGKSVQNISVENKCSKIIKLKIKNFLFWHDIVISPYARKDVTWDFVPYVKGVYTYGYCFLLKGAVRVL
jgi:hypothetical protein